MGGASWVAGAARWAAAAVVVLALAGCRGEELARVKLTSPGQTGTAAWKTTGPANGEVWIDFDGEWTGHEDDPGLAYTLEVLEGATPVQTLACTTSSCRTRVCGTTVSINNRHDSDCECKTDCAVALPKAGTFTLRATVTAVGDFHGKNASLVVRQ